MTVKTQRIVVGETSVDVVLDLGSIWIVFRNGYEDKIAEVSASKEAAIAVATALLIAVQKSDLP